MKNLTQFVILICSTVIILTILNIKYIKPFYQGNYMMIEPRANKVLDSKRKCKVPFHGILLVIVYNLPFYQNNKFLRRMYNDMFSKVVFCGPVKNSTKSNETVDIVTPHVRGYFGYHCASLAMQHYPGYEGYMSGADDMIINWWSLLKFNTSKIWNGTPNVKTRGKVYGNETGPTHWIWWKSNLGVSAYRKLLEEVKNLSKSSEIYEKFVNNSLLNGNGTHRCVYAWSDFFYIPSRFTQSYILLSQLAFKHRVFLEIAVHSIPALLEDRNNFENLNGLYVPNLPQVPEKRFWKVYNWNLTFIHPFKMKTGDPSSNRTNILEAKVIQHTNDLLKYGC